MASVYQARKISENSDSEAWRIFEKDSVTLAITDFFDFAVDKNLTAAEKKANVKQQWLDYKTGSPLINVT